MPNIYMMLIVQLPYGSLQASQKVLQTTFLSLKALLFSDYLQCGLGPKDRPGLSLISVARLLFDHRQNIMTTQL